MEGGCLNAYKHTPRIKDIDRTTNIRMISFFFMVYSLISVFFGRSKPLPYGVVGVHHYANDNKYFYPSVFAYGRIHLPLGKGGRGRSKPAPTGWWGLVEV